MDNSDEHAAQARRGSIPAVRCSRELFDMAETNQLAWKYLHDVFPTDMQDVLL